LARLKEEHGAVPAWSLQVRASWVFGRFLACPLLKRAGEILDGRLMLGKNCSAKGFARCLPGGVPDSIARTCV
jgi:hypothetical protein